MGSRNNKKLKKEQKPLRITEKWNCKKWNTEDKALIIPQPKQSNPEKNFIRHIEGVFSKAIVGIDIKTKGVRIYIPIIAEYFIFSNFNFS